jgi:mercuric ion transport protein
MNSVAPPAALVCIPNAIPARQRSAHFALARKLFGVLAEERTALPTGYAVRFPAGALDELFQFVANERRCCPFMSFELTIERDAGPIWLRMTGPEGTKAVLEAELNLTDSCACSRSDNARSRSLNWSIAGGMLAALGLCAACCLLPFVLLSVGVAGAWVSGMEALHPYKWIFVLLSVALLGYGFYVAYGRAGCRTNRATRIALWTATLLAIGGFAFEYAETLLT